MNNPETNKLFYSYYRTERSNGVVPASALSSYAHSIIFDVENRTMWHDGMPFGSSYWGSYHGESFNDIEHNTAKGDFSIATGTGTNASGKASIASGANTTASGLASITEGTNTTASGNYSHAEGNYSTSFAEASHAEGEKTWAVGKSSHAEGYYTTTENSNSHAEGLYTKTLGENSHSEGSYTKSAGESSHSEGFNSYANGTNSHAEGNYTQSNGVNSHTEGYHTISTGENSHAEGLYNESIGVNSHAEGSYTRADNVSAHTEGSYTRVTANSGHAEGVLSYSIAVGAHAEGFGTVAQAAYSHTSGVATVTYSVGSSAQGYYTQAKNTYESAFGQYNKPIEAADDIKGNNSYGGTIFTVGNGTDDNNRHNVMELHKDGSLVKNGSSYFNDNIYGPVSYTYVKSLGESANLDIILSSLLEQPKYTKPQLYYRVSVPTTTYSSVGTTWSSFTQNFKSDTIEVGRPYADEIQFKWEERTPNTTGTLMSPPYHSCDPAEIPGNFVLGYSYGLSSSMSFEYTYYDNGKLKIDGTYVNVNSYNVNTGNKIYHPLTTSHPTYPNMFLFDSENSYQTIGMTSMSYLHSTYMYFQQLYDKNVYVVAHGTGTTKWFPDGSLTLDSRRIISTKFKCYWGFWGSRYSSTKEWWPNNKQQVIERSQGFSFIEPDSTTTIRINLANYKAKALEAKYSFFIAIPDKYKLDTYEGCKIHVLQPDGVSFDMITADQTLDIDYDVNFALGRPELTTKYKIYGVNFQNPIGNPNDIISFKITKQ